MSGWFVYFGACFVPTVVLGFIGDRIQRRRPDIVFLFIMGSFAPIGVTLLGGIIISMTIIFAAPLIAIAYLLFRWDPFYVATLYIVCGMYLTGLAAYLAVMAES
jgi:hypothetical protein